MPRALEHAGALQAAVGARLLSGVVETYSKATELLSGDRETPVLRERKSLSILLYLEHCWRDPDGV